MEQLRSLDCSWLSAVDHHEVEVLLDAVYETSRGSAFESRQYGLPHDDSDGYEVEAAWCLKAGSLKEVRAGPKFDKAKWEQVDEAARHLATGKTQRIVAVTTLMTLVPCRSWFRLEPHFQLGPMPGDAPSDPLLAGTHPMRVEVGLDATGIGAVDGSRFRRRAREVQLVLNLVAPHGVRAERSGHLYEWVRDAGEVSLSERQWRKRPVGYPDPFQGRILPHFSREPGPIMREPESVDPLNLLGISAGTSLSIPEPGRSVLAGYHVLAQPERERALRAAYWFDLACTSTPASLRPLCFVTAIESLYDTRAGRGDRCPACTRPKEDSLTKKFVAFIGQHVPGMSDRWIKGLYGFRSAVVHGSGLHHLDESSYPLTRAMTMDAFSAPMIEVLIRRAICGWILSQATASPAG